MDAENNEQKAVREGRLKQYFKNLLDMRGDMMSYEEIDRMMQDNTVIHGANMWILMLAIFIASIGLNVNSTAVIIGAMLISPLMGGIMTMGYSLAVRDLSLLRRALTRFGTQVAISLIASTIYFSLTPLTEPTAELIARTSPTLWDVLIALFGGVAGMIGNTRKSKGNVVPGVAIATALMPPLCTAGYGLATGQWNFFFGALYLFLINTLFISLSAAFISLVLGVPYHKNISARNQKRINRIIGAITVILVVPSIFAASITVYNSVLDTNISTYLNNEFDFPDTQVVKSSTDKNKKVISVSLVGEPISSDVIQVLRSNLSNYSLENYTLRVTQSTGTQNSSQPDYQKLASNASLIFGKLSNCRCGVMYSAGGQCVVLIANADEEVPEQELTSIKNWLITETGIQQAEVHLYTPEGN